MSEPVPPEPPEPPSSIVVDEPVAPAPGVEPGLVGGEPATAADPEPPEPVAQPEPVAPVQPATDDGPVADPETVATVQLGTDHGQVADPERVGEPEPADPGPVAGTVPAAAPLAATPPNQPVPDPTTPPLAVADPSGASSPPLPPAPPVGDADPGEDTKGDKVTSPLSGGPPKAMILGVVALLGVLVVAFVLVKRISDKTTPDAATTSTTINTAPVNTDNWAVAKDDESGFTLKYPKGWKIAGAPAGQNRLLITAGEQNFLLVTARNVDPTTLPDVIAQAMSDLDIISGPSELRVGGLKAVLYIYKSPVTADNPTDGVIIHYFVVRGSKLYSLVFQARPREELNRLATTFNAVVNTFQSTSDSRAPEPLATTSTVPTAAGGTTSTTG